MSEDSGKGAGQRLAQFDGLRGIAAVLVFSVHFISLLAPSVPAGTVTAYLVPLFDRIAHSGTDLFFIISGFLIYGMLLRRPRPMRKFLLRRFDRIYPPFAIMLAIYLSLSIAFPEVSRLPPGFGAICRDVLMNLLLLPGIIDMPPIITVSWSLSYLLVFYLAAPLLIEGLDLRSWSRSRRVILLAAMIFGWFLLGYFFGWHIRFVMFLTGMLVYEAGEAWPDGGSSALAATAGVSVVAVMLGLPETSLNPVFRFVAISAGYGCIVFCCLRAGSLLSRMLRAPALVGFGRMSLSYFLTHGLALKIVGLIAASFLVTHPDQMWFWALLLPAFGLSVALTKPFYLWIEQRSAKIGRLTLPPWARYSGLLPSKAEGLSP